MIGKNVILICYIISRMRKCPHDQEQFQSSKPFPTLLCIILAHERTWWMSSIIYLQIKASWQRHQSRTFSFKIKSSKKILASPVKYFNQEFDPEGSGTRWLTTKPRATSGSPSLRWYRKEPPYVFLFRGQPTVCSVRPGRHFFSSITQS